MLALAISLLWLLIYAICLAGVLWLILYGVKKFIYPDLPPKIEQGVWFIYFLLVVIYVLMALAGGAPILHPSLGR